MTNCINGCDQAVCLEVDQPLISSYLHGCVEVGMTFGDTATVNLGLTEEGYLTGDIVASPKASQQLSIASDGLYVPQPGFGSNSGATGWTENSLFLVTQQTTTLSLPEGKWYISAFWNATIEKSTDTVSGELGKAKARLVIGGEEGPIVYHAWGNQAGVLGHANSRAAMHNSSSKVIRSNGTDDIDIDIQTSREPGDIDADYIVTASRLSAIAIKVVDF